MHGGYVGGVVGWGEQGSGRNQSKQNNSTEYTTRKTVQLTPNKSRAPYLGVREGDRVIGVPGGEDRGVGEDDVEVRDERAQLELLEVALFVNVVVRG